MIQDSKVANKANLCAIIKLELIYLLMPDFGPQFESPGEKKEQPEKANRDTDTASAVPESVKEGKVQEEVENEEWPKEYEISVEIEGEQLEIPVKETKIEFPDYIVEDTGGVTGYIRKQIDWERVLVGPDSNLSLQKERKFIKSAWRELSSGRFPDNTFNHSVFSGKQRMASKKMVLQKLHNPETPLNLFHEGIMDDGLQASKTYEFRRTSDNSYLDELESPKYNFYRKKKKFIKKHKGFEKRKENEKRPEELWKKIAKEVGKDFGSHVERIKSDDAYGIALGLSVSKKGFNYSMHYANKDSLIFGFSSSNDAFKKTLEATLDLYDDIESSHRIRKSLESLIEDKNLAQYTKKRRSPDYNHPVIPVLINHPQTPQLRWCHASYAYIPTEKSFNLLEFTSKDLENDEDGGINTEVEKS